MFKELLESKNIWDIYIIARWMYKIGRPFLSNEVFDGIELILKKDNPDSIWFIKSYEEDEEPVELLDKYNIITIQMDEKKVSSRIGKHLGLLLDNKTISIKPIRTYEMAYEWHKQFNGQPISYSTKVDGISMRTIIDRKDGRVIVSASRGRDSDKLWDYTDTFITKYGEYLDISSHGLGDGYIVLGSEGYVDIHGVEKMNQYYKGTYANERSCGLSVLITGIEKQFLEHLHIVGFRTDEASATLSESVDRMDLMGIETVDYTVETFIDEGFEKFCEWIDDIQKRLIDRAKEMDIPYDGVVAQVNSYDMFYNFVGTEMYSDGNIAMKFGITGAEQIDAVVDSIRLVFDGKSKENYTCKIFLQETKTSDNKNLTKISGYNLGYLIKHNIKPGSKIKVLYQSGCDPILWGCEQ